MVCYTIVTSIQLWQTAEYFSSGIGPEQLASSPQVSLDGQENDLCAAWGPRHTMCLTKRGPECQNVGQFKEIIFDHQKQVAVLDMHNQLREEVHVS